MRWSQPSRGKQVERVKQGKENDQIHIFKRSFWLSGGEWAEQKLETREEAVVIIKGTGACGSDQGGSHEGGGFWMYFKVGVMGLAVKRETGKSLE